MKKIIREVLKVMDVDLEKTIIIGDSIGTDIQLANNLHISSVLVLTGNTRSRSEVFKSKYIPSYIVDSIADVPSLMSGLSIDEAII